MEWQMSGGEEEGKAGAGGKPVETARAKEPEVQGRVLEHEELEEDLRRKEEEEEAERVREEVKRK
jgi:hypothetical protein